MKWFLTEAWDRSIASKMRLIWLDIWMISPLIKHNCKKRAEQVVERFNYIQSYTRLLSLGCKRNRKRNTWVTIMQYLYLFIVIQHSIHAFNPQRINGTVKHHPFSIRCISWCKIPKCVCHYSVSPLMITGKGENFDLHVSKPTSQRSFTLCETGSNCPNSCPIVIDFGFNVRKMTFSLSVCPLLFKRVIVSARTCKTFVFPAKGSPTSMNLLQKKIHPNVKNVFFSKGFFFILLSPFRNNVPMSHNHHFICLDHFI